MKKYLDVLPMLYNLAFICIILCSLSACSDELPSQEDINIEAKMRSEAFDNYFDWDKVINIPVYNPIHSLHTQLELPWANGSTSAYGIPLEWFDDNAYDPNTSNRYYSRENHWVLVYSNVYSATLCKQFALYNTRTGILRFFFYTISASSAGGHSNVYWGIKLDKESALFNFNGVYADAINVKSPSPSYITSPQGTWVGKEFVSCGYQVNKWYGLEIECAYDPSIVPGSNHNFSIYGWVADKTTISGQGNTTGSITGTITNVSPANFNLSLSNMCNQSSSEKFLNIDNQGIIENFGGTLEKGISGNDSFFKGLWNNIKSKAGTGIGDGVKNGLEAILTSGGNVAAKALSGAMSSILGIGGKEASVAKVDLSLKANTTFTFQSDIQLPGWGNSRALPVPGSSANPNNQPLYDEPLGIWNLRKTPVLNIEGYASEFRIRATEHYKSLYNFKYILDCSEEDLVINPSLAGKVTVSKFNVVIASAEYNPYIFGPSGGRYSDFYKPEPFGFIANEKFYSKPLRAYQNNKMKPIAYGVVFITDHPAFDFVRFIAPPKHGKFKAIVTFEMFDHETKKVYYFSRWFNTKFGSQKINCQDIRINYPEQFETYADELMNNGYPPSHGYHIWSEFEMVNDNWRIGN
ncbi:MAG: hypothetical protein LIO93_10585 [Bacteroidales bacterium]|nr:hypothetical protein [Bacteroidales bacterium]